MEPLKHHEQTYGFIGRSRSIQHHTSFTSIGIVQLHLVMITPTLMLLKFYMRRLGCEFSRKNLLGLGCELWRGY